MSKGTKMDYDSEVRELLCIYEKHKCVISSIEKADLYKWPGQATTLLWVSSEGKEVVNEYANT